MACISFFCSPLVLLLLLQSAAARPAFVQRIPNGSGVSGVQALGHVATSGGGTLNAFGQAFEAQGLAWTSALCEADSDGDGATNGEELGDPCCQWTQTAPTTLRSSSITHPGKANSFTAAQLSALKCSNSSSGSDEAQPGSMTSSSSNSSSSSSHKPSVGSTPTPTPSVTSTPTPSASGAPSRLHELCIPLLAVVSIGFFI